MKISACLPLLSLLAAMLSLPAQAAPEAYAARVAKLLARTPLIDGHNDWAEALAEKAKDARWTRPLDRLDPKEYQTDIARLRAGRVGGQFWSVWVSADLPPLQQSGIRSNRSNWSTASLAAIRRFSCSRPLRRRCAPRTKRAGSHR